MTGNIMSSINIRPAQIAWRGPSGHTVVLDEDGVHLRPGGSLEESELNELINIIIAAKGCRDAGVAETPAIPSATNIPF